MIYNTCMHILPHFAMKDTAQHPHFLRAHSCKYDCILWRESWYLHLCTELEENILLHCSGNSLPIGFPFQFLNWNFSLLLGHLSTIKLDYLTLLPQILCFLFAKTNDKDDLNIQHY